MRGVLEGCPLEMNRFIRDEAHKPKRRRGAGREVRDAYSYFSNSSAYTAFPDTSSSAPGTSSSPIHESRSFW